MDYKERQKLNWKSSKFIKVIPANIYNPEPKLPSRRDIWRLEVAARKELSKNS